jgi:hypothetical protein
MKISEIKASFTDEDSQPRSAYFAGQTVCGVLKFHVSEEFPVSGKCAQDQPGLRAMTRVHAGSL